MILIIKNIVVKIMKKSRKSFDTVIVMKHKTKITMKNE